MRIVRICGITAASMVVGASSGQNPSVTGSVQTALVSGLNGGQLQTTDRFTRTQVQLEQGNWLATASIWNYSFCDWNDLDETNFAYRWGARQIKFGRFLNPVTMSTWDDQWYSSFVFVPNLELNAYSGRKLLERTVTGIQLDSNVGSNAFKFSATSSDFQQNQLLPDKLNRLSARWTHFKKGTLFGAGILLDPDHKGGQEQMIALDIRHTIPHWIFRGQVLGYQSATARSNGFFTELTHRPSGWEDLTLGLRHEGTLGFMGSNAWIFATTASAKVELPMGTTFLANYTFGPDMNRQPLGGGLSFGLSKTIKF